MDELIKRLRNRRICIQQSGGLDDFPLLREAADAIEELSKRCEEAYSNGLLEGGIAQRAEDEKWMPRWISVEERLPEEEGSVLIFSKLGGIAEGHYSQIYGIWTQYRWNVKDIKVTHWMLLPEPPNEE